MASNLFGSLEPFDTTTPFLEYKERLDFYFEANEVTTDAKKRVIFLTVVSQYTFRTIKDLCFPDRPKDKTYDELCTMLLTQFNPTPPKFVQRKKFEERSRAPLETIQNHVVALKKLSEHCQFGSTLQDRLLDRFVMGVNDEVIQRKLLLEDNLDLEKAIKIAQSSVESKQGAKTFESSPAPVTLVKKHHGNSVGHHTKHKTCMRCVPKSDGSLRICGDYKTTLNKEVKRDEHPLPRIEELPAKLEGGEKFSSIDFSHAYTQLCLDEESQNLTTINTHCGLFKYKRLPYGISACPEIWQRTIESIFGNIPSTVGYFDNMFITGPDTATHLKTLETIFKRCKEKGLTLKRQKCEFLLDEVDFLGYRLNKEGLLPQPEKIRAIKQAPEPKNVHELKAYLGMMNYYSQFIKNL
ncbi:polyprotein [Elysia marginata]|uniref:Polyprotein n=1 Tax=Elysia marginata TaxID=1093978 RepID=A0AAV4HXX3_9GAST|nr:polyprotein [Elysia marginata]